MQQACELSLHIGEQWFPAGTTGLFEQSASFQLLLEQPRQKLSEFLGDDCQPLAAAFECFSKGGSGAWKRSVVQISTVSHEQCCVLWKIKSFNRRSLHANVVDLRQVAHLSQQAFLFKQVDQSPESFAKYQS